MCAFLGSALHNFSLLAPTSGLAWNHLNPSCSKCCFKPFFFVAIFQGKPQFIAPFFGPERLFFFCIYSCSTHDMFCLFLRAPNRVHFFVHQFVLFFAFFHATYHCFFSAFFSCAIWCFFCNSLCTKSCLKSCYCNWAWQNHNIEPAFFPESWVFGRKPQTTGQLFSRFK